MKSYLFKVEITYILNRSNYVVEYHYSSYSAENATNIAKIYFKEKFPEAEISTIHAKRN
jgi:hypothetical protein